jgi:small-conductance mechanosensitive channel
MEWMGIRWLGITPENGQKLLLTIALILIAQLIRLVGRWMIDRYSGSNREVGVRFWAHQALALILFVLTAFGVMSIWFDNPARLTTAMGLATAGIAFALQKVITSLAGYLVILRGKTFTIGDRITMGGVRGDVAALGFMQTTIMEMGQPPSVQNADPAMWVRSRQFTGRIVTVANSRIFDEPVYNYTRDFPYIWEEMRLPIGYSSDYKAAEAMLLSTARRYAVRREAIDDDTLRRLRERFSIDLDDVDPRIFYRLTDNWVELSARFLVSVHGVREIKDRMSRELLQGLRDSGIDVASSTFDVVGLPPLRVRIEGLDEARRELSMQAGRH